ncbi:hypothetical protein ACEE34_10975 [Staphylococcus rostri]
MRDIIHELLEHTVFALLIVPGVLKQLRLWHLGYLDRQPNNKE